MDKPKYAGYEITEVEFIKDSWRKKEEVMTPEDREKAAADAAISAVLYELQANGVEGKDLQAAAIGALWKAMEDEAVGMSKYALKRLIFGEDHIVDANKMVQPVAWQSWNDTHGYGYWATESEALLYCAKDFDPVPLYAAPQQPAPQPLTDEQIDAICDQVFQQHQHTCGSLIARAIERAHGIGEQP